MVKPEIVTAFFGDFSKMKYDNDILINIIINKRDYACVYDSVRIQATDFPVLTCATTRIDSEYRIAIGARPGRAHLYADKNGILADGITCDSAKLYAESLSQTVPTCSNVRASDSYRSRLVQVLTERNLIKLGGLI